MKPKPKKTATIASMIGCLLERRRQVIEKSDGLRLDVIMSERDPGYDLGVADGRIQEIEAQVDALSDYPLKYEIPTVEEARSWKGMRTGSHGPSYDRQEREIT